MPHETKTKQNTLPAGDPTQRGQSPASLLVQEYQRWQALFQAQPALTQRFYEVQAQALADALIQPMSSARFAFPERVVLSVSSEGKVGSIATIPQTEREQLVGGLRERLSRATLGVVLRQRLDELEASRNKGVSTGAGLLRFATAGHLVHERLPSGRVVTYLTAEGEEIPSIPAEAKAEAASAIIATTDAIAEEDTEDMDGARGELLVPYVPAARRFFLPQWVAFDEQDHLLVNSVNEAEASIVSMQRYLKILHASVALAPYMVADEIYQRKRYGMLGQLINQGRALARYETGEIIATIWRRAAAHDLNRGLSLSLPFFDDQDLEVKSHDFDVIPAGRVMFVPGFVVLAARREQAKVDQDTRLSRSTRMHLYNELQMLASTFEPSSK
ncbi:MAG: hypothetical protein A2W35_18275 [Chloroflexi bacterium RBG_16_57_11]|nr:MAG: hypothetical protein A2W35_18275 [Chloroflexi bacterium RBG_16_57_11]